MRKIPEPTILRLSAYRRCLEEGKEETNQPFISSKELGRLSNRNAALVRKDLSYFGEYGVPGKGYDVDHLLWHILRIMNLEEKHSALLVGVGNLGKALLGYPGFRKHGFEIIAAFDCDLNKIGRKIDKITIQKEQEIAEVVKKRRVKIGILTVPATAAQEAANLLMKAGIRAIINFTPARIWAPKGTVVRNVDLTRELEVVAYYLKR